MNTSARALNNGGISHWYVDSPAPVKREQLATDISADVVLVGAGYTGLWAAYYIKKAAPHLNVMILEAEVAGFGASGRNGGWLGHKMPGKARRYAISHGVESVTRFQRELFTTIDEIIEVAAAEGIEADLKKDGMLAVATTPSQLARLKSNAANPAGWGFKEEDRIFIPQEKLSDYANLEGGMAGIWSPHCARVQPAKLALGLAETVEALGVKIYEHTPVSEIRPRKAFTASGLTVSADYIIRGTEGFTPSIRGEHRTWLPKLSSMIVTAPIAEDVMAQIGWDSAVMVRDNAHSFSHMHRTADGRIALGGPGKPYFFGSKTDVNGETPRVAEDELITALHRLLPVLEDTPIDRTWTGVLGIPRDWSATVQLDPETGLGVAGGYVGDGVAGANLAGRTLRDLILKNDSDLVTLPWVGRKIRKWEPEPVRWIAVTGLYWAYNKADQVENRRGNGKTSKLATMANFISGRY